MYRVAGGPQCCLRLGELGMDDDGSPWPQCPGEEYERLCAARGEKHLGRVAAMVCGDRVAGEGLIRIASEVAQRLGDRPREPIGHRIAAHVHGKIDQAAGEFEVAVVTQCVSLVHRSDLLARLSRTNEQGGPHS